ncbi:hypothetical protein, partial [Crenothrix polyspora]|uniref:hypothetical protein n=1 Tax=Crenothrix polyspora TaxID=360316 RepID=UPI001C3CD70D
CGPAWWVVWGLGVRCPWLPDYKAKHMHKGQTTTGQKCQPKPRKPINQGLAAYTLCGPRTI